MRLMKRNSVQLTPALATRRVDNLREIIAELLRRIQETAGLPLVLGVALRSFLAGVSDDDLYQGARTGVPLLRELADAIEQAANRDSHPL